jgi:hypothetical protein
VAGGGNVPKHVLKSLEFTTWLVALDHLEEHGPNATVPDPYEVPGECAYLTYIGDEHAAALAGRVQHLNVAFKIPGATGRTRQVRKVYNRAAILHLMRFSFPTGEDFASFVRGLETVDRRYWRVLDAKGEPIQPPRGKSKGKG